MRMIRELSDGKLHFGKKLSNILHISTNYLSDLFFGFTVFFFAWAFTENVSLLEYSQAFGISLKNMVGMDSYWETKSETSKKEKAVYQDSFIPTYPLLGIIGPYI